MKEEYRALVEAHGKFLAANPDRKVTIQGNTDERGGSEYNLALGQKRAEAVRRAMALAGARDSQLEAVSFGKEKPKSTTTRRRHGGAFYFDADQRTRAVRGY